MKTVLEVLIEQIIEFFSAGKIYFTDQSIEIELLFKFHSNRMIYDI